ncbi:MAG: magnesium/cobalt transporter CorA [Elusimicrobiota bacterium]
MARLIKRMSKKSQSSPPGALVYTGSHRGDPVTVKVMDYDADRLDERRVDRLSDCRPFSESATVTWLDVCGLHDVARIEELGSMFGLHALLLEDILHTGQRPKMEEHERHIFLVLKMLRYDDAREILTAENVAVVFGKNHLISFQERPGDVFDGVRDRIRKAKGRIRRAGPDYLAYALTDAVVDEYFSVVERIGDRIEALEERVIDAASPELLTTINRLQREMIHLRKAVWPLREAVNRLQKADHALIDQETIVYLRDLYDHTVQIVEAIDSYREMLSGLMDVYLSSVSNKMNEVMKTLTIFAAIFIPLTFLAGIYGMNFDYIPELKLHWGYAMFWVAVFAVGGGMALHFRRKGWL